MPLMEGYSILIMYGLPLLYPPSPLPQTTTTTTACFAEERNNSGCCFPLLSWLIKADKSYISSLPPSLSLSLKNKIAGNKDEDEAAWQKGSSRQFQVRRHRLASTRAVCLRDSKSAGRKEGQWMRRSVAHFALSKLYRRRARDLARSDSKVGA